ncbi:MAG: hypothetical protein ACRD2Z_04845 [Thermoanaerobaculia bacterium]
MREPAKGRSRAFELLAGLPDEFLPEGRGDTPPQEREISEEALVASASKG